eukprot:TRINITY_DN65761_c8_g1_i1.p1 TRINITY_DN65761_c8_g1~~TRINITY_DN65761_c8_g1_i1.p1  ORF type:complete len:835 (-),score=71.96 TRINITY_DN65761_c8_g1_i1:1376-3880(-)
MPFTPTPCDGGFLCPRCKTPVYLARHMFKTESDLKKACAACMKERREQREAAEKRKREAEQKKAEAEAGPPPAKKQRKAPAPKGKKDAQPRPQKQTQQSTPTQPSTTTPANGKASTVPTIPTPTKSGITILPPKKAVNKQTAKPKAQTQNGKAPPVASTPAPPPAIPNYGDVELTKDHAKKPLWIANDPDPTKIEPHIWLETFSPQYTSTQQFLIAIAEPLSRTHLVHEYVLTEDSLFAAVSLGIDATQIIDQLTKLSKIKLTASIVDFISKSTKNFGKVRMVLESKTYFIESRDAPLIHDLFNKDALKQAIPADAQVSSITIPTDSGGDEPVYRFPIVASQVENVKEYCKKENPLSMYYDFHKDFENPSIDLTLKSTTRLRRYQEISLSKMFTNGRSRWGIIVLPCGAGKTLVGVTATCTIQKRTLVLCLNNVSVEQWIGQYKTWSTIHPRKITKFTSQSGGHEPPGDIVVTTYNMLNYQGQRSGQTQHTFNEITSIDWGLVLLDEVHVVPAQTFRTVFAKIKTHCALGLTATLLREDEKIDDLKYLIGPKLYEANWLELSKAGSLATVYCIEVHCPMTKHFYKHWLDSPPSKHQPLYIMNPIKFATTQALIEYHEARGDKIIVFSDSVLALQEYAKRLERPFIHGDVMNAERLNVLEHFKKNKVINTVFISKVGDASIDLPEATVIIQISSHFGSRRQEAQRLGRILRPKPKGMHHTNQAYFYSLVSADTEELLYCSKRQQFLLNQGYAFKIVSSKEIIKTCCENFGKNPDSDPPPFGLTEEEQKTWFDTIMNWNSAALRKEEEKAKSEKIGVAQKRRVAAGSNILRFKIKP